MNILITGGKGFLAGRLNEYLKKKKFKITLCSRKKSKDTVKINWNSNKSLNKICKNIDVIINCAGLDIHGCNSKKKSLKVNSVFPSKLYNAAKINNVRLFIFLSTFHVYKIKPGLILEGNNLNRGNNYTLSKIEGEKNLLQKQTKKTKVLILRVCNLFGHPHYKSKNCWRLLINSVAKDLITKNKFQVKSKENSYRNYSSIESFSEFIYRLILTREKFKKLPKIINYCSEKNINITEICNVIKKNINNKKNRILFKYPEIKKVKKTYFSSKYQTDFKNLKDKYFFQELRNLIKYIKKNFK